MKKWSLLAIGIIALAGLTWAGVWAWNNLRGVGPVIKGPPVNVSDVINTNENPLETTSGFRLSVFAKGFEKPRDLLTVPTGSFMMLLSDTGTDKVYILRDTDDDGIADNTSTLLEDLNEPHGLALDCGVSGCMLWIAETNRLMRYDFNDADGTATNPQKIMDFPTGGHFTRSLLIHGDDLLVSIGSSCNVCKEDNALRASIQAVNMQTGEVRPYAMGLRNSVFMALHPETGEVWTTEMGRDQLGDDIPPEEVNIIAFGKDYGWPYCYGNKVRDATFQKNDAVSCEKNTTAPRLMFQAHSAPLGLTFVPDGIGWPESMIGDLLVSFHGSWNRTEPTGYKVVRFNTSATAGDEAVDSQHDFISGWLTEENEAIGRPVDVEFGSDNALYISDDKAGVIYRMTYGEETPAQGTCRATGCSGQICADEEVVTDCLYTPEYACYQNTVCERQESGECGWTTTPELIQCLETAGAVVAE